MHLYRAGMPLVLLAEFLGHADVNTTRVYAWARTVYMYLRDRAGGGSCWPGVKTIARDLHLSPRTVQRPSSPQIAGTPAGIRTFAIASVLEAAVLSVGM